MHLKKLIFVAILALPISGVAQAATQICKISIVGGSFKGRTMKVTMQDGKIVGDSSFRDSTIATCRGMKYFYGRWYNLCPQGKIAVLRKKGGVWKRLHPDNEKKYIHNCF